MENRQDALNNTRLLAAVARMEREQSRESREAVLDAVILSAQFLAPVIIEDVKPGEDTAIQFQLIANHCKFIFVHIHIDMRKSFV